MLSWVQLESARCVAVVVGYVIVAGESPGIAMEVNVCWRDWLPMVHFAVMLENCRFWLIEAQDADKTSSVCLEGAVFAFLFSYV